jgi:AraC family transcriptional regulator, transcriptional activator of pobA
MDIPGPPGTFPAFMKPTSPVAVAFREVRHFRPDDWLHCESLDVRGRLHDWTIPAHRHEGLHQFQWLSAGRAELSLDGEPRALHSPAVLMVAPGSVHAFRFDPGSAGMQVTVPSARLVAAFADAPALAERLRASRVLQGEGLASGVERITALFEALAAEFAAAEPGRSEALQAHLVLLATWVLRQGGDLRPGAARSALRDTLVQRYRALLELHLRRHEPLAFYAGLLHVTPDHLSRACRAVTGLSALDLLHERMLVEARRLLAYTQAPVADIAGELGFDDPAYFSRFFARRAGHSPVAYRAALGNGQAVLP